LAAVIAAAAGVAGASSEPDAHQSIVTVHASPARPVSSTMTAAPPPVVTPLPAGSATNEAVAEPSATLTQTISVSILPAP
jgi:hypothetical protein